jgi:hypothetical protein
MKRKKPEPVPAPMNCEPVLELKPVPLSVSRDPAPEPRFLPPVTLSYESTLELKPIPATLGVGKAGKRTAKAARTPRPKKAK